MTCAYEFELDARSREERELRPDDPGVENGVWTCPHEAVDGRERCPFHRPPPPGGDDRVDRLLDRVETPATAGRHDRERRRQFVGALFDDVALRDLVISGPDLATIDLRHCEIRGDLRIERTTCDHLLDLSGATIYGETEVDTATFRRGLWASGATFKKSVRFSRTDVTGEAEFDRTTLEDGALFAEAAFDVGPNFELADSDAALEFDGSDFGARQDANFRGCTVADDLGFRNVTAASDLVLKRVTVGAGLSFERAHVDASVGIAIREPPDTDAPDGPRTYAFDGARIDSVDVRLGETAADRYLSFENASVEAGRIGFPADESAVVDVRDATLGDVRFDPTTAADSRSPLDHVFFLRTDFDGFDFTDTTLPFDRDPAALPRLTAGCAEIVLRADERKARELAEIAEETTVETDPDVDYRDMIATYLKAKTGADEAGAGRLAGSFYKREMAYRRRLAVARLRTYVTDGQMRPRRRLTRGALTLGGLVENRLLGATTAYGESPIRVVGWMLVTVAAFGAFFALVGAETGVSVGGSVGSQLLLSAQVFVSVFLGAPPGDGDVSSAVAVASTVEGFLGALLVALLVFTLTRRVHR